MSSFNACYLLTTLDPAHVGGTYIGFTVKPSRRIRQHNGEIKAGAWRTKKWRPWEMVMFIHGFPSKVCVQTCFSETLFSCKLLAVHDCAFYEAHGLETRIAWGQVAALQFEWAWQNPKKSRWVKDTVSKLTKIGRPYEMRAKVRALCHSYSRPIIRPSINITFP